MENDPIVDEIRQARHDHAAKFDNDLSAIVADIRRLEKESGRNYIKFPPRLLSKSLEKKSAGSRK